MSKAKPLLYSPYMQLTTIYGTTENVTCIACSTLNQTQNPTNKFLIAKSKYFRAEQDYEVPIPGFVIVASNRHFYSVDEMSEAEQADFIRFVASVRKAMRQVLNIDYVQMILNERTASSHFHLWLFPRYDWMEEKFGTKLDSIEEIMRFAKETMKSTIELDNVYGVTLYI